MTFQNLSTNEIQALAGRYILAGKPARMVREARIETSTALEVKLRGFYRKPELLEVLRWRSSALLPALERNSEEYIQNVTGTAFSVKDERLRIEMLTLLEGVRWGAASVLLHFGHPGRYPVLDARAFYALGLDWPRQMGFATWQEYTLHCRALADGAHVSMRILDRALRQYAKENSRSKAG